MSHYIKTQIKSPPKVPEKFADNKIVVGTSKLLNLIISRFKLRNDCQLAEFLGTSAPVISKIRNGKFPIGDGLMIRIHEELGIHVRDIKALITAG